jgi:hypothetical protein
VAARRRTTATSGLATTSVDQTIDITMTSKRSPRSIPRAAETAASAATAVPKLSTKSHRIVRSTLFGRVNTGARQARARVISRYPSSSRAMKTPFGL